MTNEGVLKLVLTSTQLDDGVPIISEKINLQDLPWRMMVVSQDTVHSSQGGKRRTVGVFVQCIPESPGSQNWSASAHVVLRVQNHNNVDKSFVKVFDHTYSSTSSDWGYSSFMKYKDLTDVTKGFMKEDQIFIEAKIQLKSKSVQPVLAIGSVDSFLACPRCAQNFETNGDRQPMSLRCGHTFCSVCLQKASSKSEDKISLMCTSCNQVHTAKNGIETELWFPNHSMVQIIEKMVSKSKFFCQTHQHDKNYYCFDDHRLVCIYCAYHGEHSTHTCKHVDEARKEAEMSLKKVKLSMSNHISEIERRVNFVKDEKNMLKSQESRICRMIEDCYEQLNATLLRQKELLFQELKSQTSECSSSIDSNLLKLEEKSSKMKSVLSEYSSWQTLSAKEALDKYTEVQTNLSSIATLCSEVKQSLQSEPCPKLSFEMKNLSEILSFGQLGRIIVGEKAEHSVGTDGAGEMGYNGLSQELPPTKRKKMT